MMTAKEKLEILIKINNMSQIVTADVPMVFKAYADIINPNHALCSTCGDGIRKAAKTLSEFFNNNQEALRKQVIEEELND